MHDAVKGWGATGGYYHCFDVRHRVPTATISWNSGTLNCHKLPCLLKEFDIYSGHCVLILQSELSVTACDIEIKFS
jgi:hypothetical protein